MVSGATPVLVTVSVFTAALWPAGTSPKSSADASTLICGGSMTVPVSGTRVVGPKTVAGVGGVAGVGVDGQVLGLGAEGFLLVGHEHQNDRAGVIGSHGRDVLARALRMIGGEGKGDGVEVAENQRHVARVLDGDR